MEKRGREQQLEEDTRTFGRHSPALFLLRRGELAEVLLSLPAAIKVRRVDLDVVASVMEVVVDVELLAGVFFVDARAEGH